MGLSKCHLYFLWYFLLVAVLTYPTEESTIRTTRERRFLWNQVQQTAEKLKDSLSSNINKIFNIRLIHNTENTSTLTTTELITTTVLPNVESRQIIVVPIKCPDNHVNIDGRCRLIIE